MAKTRDREVRLRQPKAHDVPCGSANSNLHISTQQSGEKFRELPDQLKE